MMTRLLLLSIIAMVGCAHTPAPVSDTTGFVVAEAPSWSAWTNDMPLGPRSLHVVGEVTVTNGRYVAQLNPSDESTAPGVHCKLEVVERRGLGTAALTMRKVHFIDTKYAGNDPQVIVHFPDGTTLKLPIESAQ